MKEIVQMQRVSQRKSIDGELPVIMPGILAPSGPKFKWGDFDEEEILPPSPADHITGQSIEQIAGRSNSNQPLEASEVRNVGSTDASEVKSNNNQPLETSEMRNLGSTRALENSNQPSEAAVMRNVGSTHASEVKSNNNQPSEVREVRNKGSTDAPAADEAQPSEQPSRDEASSVHPQPVPCQGPRAAAAASSPSRPDVSPSPTMDINTLMERFNGGSARESKERFRQRLWCYLFENLNRAIDELYFMCELECDMEQIQEALLVFNDAGLDFVELKDRVENFEALRKKSPCSPGGEVEKDKAMLEQRPHAIAWEVRRMASSSRRADILSMSLEAFKKSQTGAAAGQRDSSSRHVKRRNAVRFLSFIQEEDPQDKKPEAERVEAISPNASSDHAPCEEEVAVAPAALPAAPSPPPASASASTPSPTPAPPAASREAETSPGADKEDKPKTAMEAWKEKKNWEDILSSPLSNACNASKSSASPGSGRKSIERGRVLHDKLMSPERKKKTPMEMKKEVDEKQARATRIRRELENERALRLQRTTEKLNRVSEWQAVRNMKMREGMHARQQRGESRHEAHLAQIARRASDESSKVSEVRFITSLNEENKKLSLQQKLQDSELRRAERLQSMRIKQKEDVAREEAALERRKLLEAERLQRIAETQRRKEEAQARREEERKAATAAREARAVEQVRKKEVRAKAQQEEVELLRQKLAERLRESALRRKIYLEQIRERAVMDTREQGSPLSRRPSSRDGQNRVAGVDPEVVISDREMSSGRLVKSPGSNHHQALKKRIKKIRQRLTTRRFEFVETPGATEVTAASRSKLGRWVQELQRHQQARKAGASATVAIVAEIIKYLDGKEFELHIARHTGLVELIATALPASHTSKPETSQTTMALLKLLVVLLSLPANRSYILARNFLPPIIPILSAALENYSTVGSSSENEKFEALGDALEDLLKCVTMVIGHSTYDERQVQMQDDLVELIVACDIIHRLRNLFALFDRPQIEGAPFPPPVLLGLKFLETLTRRKLSASTMASQFQKSIGFKRPGPGGEGQERAAHPEGNNRDSSNEDATQSQSADNERLPRSFPCQDSLPLGAPEIEESRKQQHQHPIKCMGFLLVAIADTGLVGLPSLLTAVLLQANPRASSAEQAVFSLPSNFEEVATSVLRVLNNTACLDLSLVQTMLSMPDLKMEFFHLVSFLLSYCTCKWKGSTDQVASLILETLLLLGYFALLHGGNQAVLRWGKSPTMLHKICDLPFAFFSDPELTPILVGTLLAACYGSERNRDVIQQELSMELLLSVLTSSKGLNSDSRQGVQSAEALLSRQQGRRMDVITEESEVDQLQQQGVVSSDRVEDEVELPSRSARSISKQQPKKGVKCPVAFLLENRFPPSLWENAIDFFSLK